MDTRKAKQHAAIRERAERAMQDMYHNATPTYPRDTFGRSDDYFQSWFEGIAEFEIEYLRDGGATGTDYAKTLAAPCNAGKYYSERTRRYYIAKGLRAQRAEQQDCGMLTGWKVLELAAGNEDTARKLKAGYARSGGAEMKRNNALWECISELGKLYQYGRGGRTLAPDGVMFERDNIKHDALSDEHSIAETVRLLRIVESFNAYVGAWCASVPEQWREHCEEEDREELAAKRAKAARKAKETRERNYWANRDVITVQS